MGMIFPAYSLLSTSTILGCSCVVRMGLYCAGYPYARASAYDLLGNLQPHLQLNNFKHSERECLIFRRGIIHF